MSVIYSLKMTNSKHAILGASGFTMVNKMTSFFVRPLELPGNMRAAKSLDSLKTKKRRSLSIHILLDFFHVIDYFISNCNSFCYIFSEVDRVPKIGLQ